MDKSVTVEEREMFLRGRVWRPDLPEDERLTIEREWPDDAIHMALWHSF